MINIGYFGGGAGSHVTEALWAQAEMESIGTRRRARPYFYWETMVKFDVQGDKLHVSFFSRDRFQDLLESAHYLNLRFDATKKVWVGDVPRLDEYVDEFSSVEPCEVSELARRRRDEYMSSLMELKMSRRVLDFSIMKCPPLIGKHPYENFQREDIRRAFCSNRFLFAWGTGTGKSYALACLYANLRQSFGVKKAVLFSSPIGLLNIKREIIKFIDIDPDTISTISRVTGVKERNFFKPQYDVVIIGYDAMKYSQEYYYSLNNKNKKSKGFQRNQIPWAEWLDGGEGVMFLDESHLVGNPGSRRSECVEMSLDRFEYRYLFSATPWDSLHKAYLQLKTLDRALVDGLGYTSWLSDYYDIGTKYSRWAPDLQSLDAERERALNEKLFKSYGAKRKKEDVLDIPPQYEVPTIEVDMSPEQREIYEGFSTFVVEKVVAESEKNDNGLVQSLTNNFAFAMLAVENPTVILDSERFIDMGADLKKKIEKFKYARHFSKLSALDSIIEEECDELDEKVLIFYIHPRTMESLVEHYDKRKPFVIKAGMSNEERFAMVDAFREHEGKGIMIASMLIANASINLEFVGACVILERSWRFDVVDQAKGRTSRATSTRESRVYNLSYSNSLDHLQLRNLETKGAVVDNIMRKSILKSHEWRAIFGGGEV